jgi:hypothetical protein
VLAPAPEGPPHSKYAVSHYPAPQWRRGTHRSRYVINGITDWIDGWKRNGWINSQKKPVKNRELWEKLDAARKRHTVSFSGCEDTAGARVTNGPTRSRRKVLADGGVSLWQSLPRDFTLFLQRLIALGHLEQLNKIVSTSATHPEMLVPCLRVFEMGLNGVHE